VQLDVAEMLKDNLGKTVLIKIKRGKNLRGLLEGFDQHLNLLLRGVEDVSLPEKAEKLGTTVIRGDNISFIILAQTAIPPREGGG